MPSARAIRSSLQVAAKTDVGRVRTNNEDNLAYDLASGVFVVCDGMGGQAFGEIASKVAVEAVIDFFKVKKGSPPPEDQLSTEPLAQAVHAANRAVRAAEREKADHAGMGTTIVALRIEGEGATIAHVGDSRAYLFRQMTLNALTEDHSLVAEQVRRGVLTPEQAERSSWQNVLLRAVGTADEIDVDVRQIAPAGGDIFLLASDGLTRTVSDQEIASILGSSNDLNSICDRLIAAANAAGGEDNITCLLVRVVNGPGGA